MRSIRVRSTGRLWIALLSLLGSGCAGSVPSADSSTSRPATPPYYRIEGSGGADLLLLGTVHFGPAQGWDLSPALDADIAQADRFVFEVDPRTMEEAGVGDLLAELAVLEPGRRLSALVAPETSRLLEARDAELTRLGFPRGAREGREPWYVAVGLVDQPVEANGWSMAAAVELQVLGEIGDRPIVGLESVEAQLRILDGLPYPLQDLMLRDTLAHMDEATDSLKELARAWQSGDEKTLSRLAREGVDELPGLDGVYEVLLGDRNRRWIEQLRPLLDDPAHAGEAVFVAVGALHLPGRDGLVALLRAAGYRAEVIPQIAARAAPKERRP